MSKAAHNNNGRSKHAKGIFGTYRGCWDAKLDYKAGDGTPEGLAVKVLAIDHLHEPIVAKRRPASIQLDLKLARGGCARDLFPCM